MTTKLTAIMFGMSISKTVASGTQVSGTKVDIPTRRIAFVVDLPEGTTPVQAAEYAFDLSNNPEQGGKWASVAGRTRSLSTGDVVLVGDDFAFLCLPVGWRDISADKADVIECLEADGTWSGRRAIAG